MADLFRKSSMERLSSPEQLDTLITITSPRKWIILMTIGLVLAAGLIWGILGRIPIKVDTQGILVSSGGTTDIISTVGGQITDINVEEGDTVQKGDLIAIIGETELVKQITKNNELTDTLESLSPDRDWTKIEIPAELTEFQQLLMQIQTQKSAEQIAALDPQYALEEYNMYKKLYEEKQATKEQLDAKYAAYEKAEAAYHQQVLTTHQSIDQFYSNKNSKLKALKEENKEVRKTINSKYRILSAADGKIASVEVEKGSMIGAGTAIANVINTGTEIKKLEGVIYVPVSDGKKLTEGMDVKLYPSTVQKEEYGYMEGTIIEVPEYPVNGQAILNTLGNQALAQQVSGNGAPLEVTVDLTSDKNTVSGYAWSSKKGADVNVENGTLCAASVVVEEQSPISMVIPILKKKVLPFE